MGSQSWQMERNSCRSVCKRTPAPRIAFPPYRSDVSSLIKSGINLIEVRVIGSLKNLLGPHHNNPKPGMVSPWIWRNVKGYPSGNDYQMLDYGLSEEFVLHSVR